MFIESEFVTHIKIHPEYLDRDIKLRIVHVLKEKYGDHCSEFGYIIKDTIELTKHNAGELEQSTLSGYIKFCVHFKCKVCNPYQGSVIKAKVKGMNDFGVMCIAGYDDESNSIFVTVIEAIVVKKSMSKPSDVEILRKLSINDTVKIKILRKKFRTNDAKIQVIGVITDPAEDEHILFDDSTYNHNDLINVVNWTTIEDLEFDDDTEKNEDDLEIDVEEEEEDENENEVEDEEEDDEDEGGDEEDGDEDDDDEEEEEGVDDVKNK